MSKDDGIESRALDIKAVFKASGDDAIALEWTNEELPGAGSPESWSMLTDQKRIKETGMGGELNNVTLTCPFDLALYKKFLGYNLDGKEGILTFSSKYTEKSSSYKVGVGAIGFNSNNPNSAFEFTVNFIVKDVSTSSAGDATFDTSAIKETRALDWKVSFSLEAGSETSQTAVTDTQLEWTNLAFPGMEDPESWTLRSDRKLYKESGIGGNYTDVQVTVPYIEENHAKYLQYNRDGRQGTLTYTHKTASPARSISFKIGFGEVGNASSAPSGGMEHTIGFIVKSCDQVTKTQETE